MRYLGILLLLVGTSIVGLAQEVAFIYDYDEGLERAKAVDKPIFLFFTGISCENPVKMNALVEGDKEILAKLQKSYVPVVLRVDDRTKILSPRKVIRDGKEISIRSKGNLWAYIESTKYHHNVQPLIVIVDKEESVLKQPMIGVITKEELLDYLER